MTVQEFNNYFNEARATSPDGSFSSSPPIVLGSYNSLSFPNSIIDYLNQLNAALNQKSSSDDKVIPPLEDPVYPYDLRVYNEPDSNEELEKVWNSNSKFKKLAIPDFQYIRDFDKVLLLLGRSKNQRIATIANSLWETGGGRTFKLRGGSGEGVYLFTAPSARLAGLNDFLNTPTEYGKYASVLELIAGSPLLDDNHIGLILYEDYVSRFDKPDTVNWVGQKHFDKFMDPNSSYLDVTDAFSAGYLRPGVTASEQRRSYADFLAQILPETSEEYQLNIPEVLTTIDWDSVMPVEDWPVDYNNIGIEAYENGGEKYGDDERFKKSIQADIEGFPNSDGIPPSLVRLLIATPGLLSVLFSKDALFNLLSKMQGEGDFEKYIEEIIKNPGITFSAPDINDEYFYNGRNTFKYGSPVRNEDPSVRNLVRQLVYGDAPGMEPYIMKNDDDYIKINGKPLSENYKNQYIGLIFPYSEIYIPEEARPYLENFAKSRRVMLMDNAFSYYGDEFFPEGMPVQIDDVTEHGASFNFDDPDNPTLRFFDNWNFGDTSFSKWSEKYPRLNRLAGLILEHATKPNKKYPNSGSFVLRQDVPIKFINYDQWKDIYNSEDDHMSYKAYSLPSFYNTLKTGDDRPELNELLKILTNAEGAYLNRLDKEELNEVPLFEEGGRKEKALNVAKDVLSFVPYVGDGIALYDAYNDLRNLDYLSAALTAGLTLLPLPAAANRFATRAIKKGIRAAIPTVNKHFTEKALDNAIRKTEQNNLYRSNARKQLFAEYENWIDNPDVYRRLVNTDKTYGTNYMDAYTNELNRYLQNSPDMTDITLEPMESGIHGRFSSSTPSLIVLNSNEARNIRPTEGLVSHELGHKLDLDAGLYDRYGNTKELFGKNPFKSRKSIEKLYPGQSKFIYDYLRDPTEIKSHMNEFRTYLRENGLQDPSGIENLKDFIKKLEESNNENLKLIFDSYKDKKQFIKDFNTIPVTRANGNLTNGVLV